MYSLGMDLGTSTVKIVLMQNGTVEVLACRASRQTTSVPAAGLVGTCYWQGTRHLLFV